MRRFLALLVLASVFVGDYCFGSDGEYLLADRTIQTIMDNNKSKYIEDLVWSKADLQYWCGISNDEDVKSFVCNRETPEKVRELASKSWDDFFKSANEKNISLQDIKLVKIEKNIENRRGLDVGDILLHVKSDGKKMVIRMDASARTETGWKMRNIEWAKLD